MFWYYSYVSQISFLDTKFYFKLIYINCFILFRAYLKNYFPIFQAYYQLFLEFLILLYWNKIILQISIINCTFVMYENVNRCLIWIKHYNNLLHQYKLYIAVILSYIHKQNIHKQNFNIYILTPSWTCWVMQHQLSIDIETLKDR